MDKANLDRDKQGRIITLGNSQIKSEVKIYRCSDGDEFSIEIDSGLFSVVKSHNSNKLSS
jgi:hypothetical protein